MCSTITQVEEIPRMDFMVPEIRLKIIQLNLNDRGQSLTPPPPTAGEGSVLQMYAHQPIVKKRLHKLKSYNHLLHQKCQGRHLECDKRLLNTSPKDVVPSNCCSKNDGHAKDSLDEVKDDHLIDENSVYQVSINGIYKLCGYRKKISNTILQLLNEHTLSVARKEHLLFGKIKPLSDKSTLNQILLQSALMAMNELVDNNVLDISQESMIRLGQCLTFSLILHKALRQLGKNTWNMYAQVFRDAWMSFGCLGAMFIVSSMRK